MSHTHRSDTDGVFIKEQTKYSGFTLVELMVVVAIIGILAAVGIPSFKKYQAKSKTTEAKVQLAAAYTAIITFEAEYAVFANCFPTMGYDPSGDKANRYYYIGAPTDDGDNNNTIARNNGATCIDGNLVENVSFFHAGKAVGGRINTVAWGGIGIDYFDIVAAGYISPPPFTNSFIGMPGGDVWTIDQNKKLDHGVVGY